MVVVVVIAGGDAVKPAAAAAAVGCRRGRSIRAEVEHWHMMI